MITAANVMDMSASLLNDTAKSLYTYAAQLPYLNMALRDLAQKLELNNVPVTNATSTVIPILANGDNIGGGQPYDPLLPEGLVDIQQLWQRTTGTNDPFIPISKYEFLPHYWQNVESTYIPAWAWMGQVIKFIPSNTNIDVKMDFIENVLPLVTTNEAPIRVLNSMNYLGFRTAALCSKYIGENPTRADSLDGEAMVAFSEVLGISTKGNQSIATRRRPYMMSWKSVNNWS